MAPNLPLTAKKLARAIVPHSRRAQLRETYSRVTWPLYAGTRVRCNCCGGRFRGFRTWTDDVAVPWPMCPRCGSLGRQRVDWLYLSERTDLLRAPTRLLHVAPEHCFQRVLRATPGISYLSADYDSAAAMERMDITDIGHPDASFDVVICNHVLEHVSDDLLAMREIFRVLRPGGWAMLQVPIDAREATFEDPTITDPKERLRVFGQHDHARIYGRDYPERLRSQGFDVSADAFVKELSDDTVREFGLDVDETVYIARKPMPVD
jgi:SAM-dependent methyltransferase